MNPFQSYQHDYKLWLKWIGGSVIFLLFPILCLSKLLMNKSNLNDKIFLREYGSLYGNLRMYKW